MQILAPILVLATLTIGTVTYPALKRYYNIWRCRRFLRSLRTLPQQASPTWRIDSLPPLPHKDKNGGAK